MPDRPDKQAQRPDPGFHLSSKDSESFGLPTDLLSQSQRRLQVLALIYGGVYFISFFLVPQPAATHVAFEHLVLEVLAGAFILGALLMSLALRNRWINPDRVQTAGMAFQVYGAIGIEIGMAAWNGDPRVIPMGLSWTTVWIVSFPLFVPAPPRITFWPALAAASTRPLMFGIVVLRGVSLPEPAVLAQLIVPAYLCVGIAVLASRVVYGLGKNVAQARRMGSYHLSEKLGEGGMGEVWKAEHMMLARPAAIKLIRTDVAGVDVASPERFEREVQAAAQLRSPHTIAVYDYGVTSDRTFYYVMELLEGIDLERIIQSNGPLPSARVVHILRQVCASLAEAHEQGMVHRDIKPANVFLCRYGRELDFVKLLDFGLVKRSTDAQGSNLALTQAGAFTGTPAYASPEMARGDPDEIDARTDIYSLGCVAFWLLTARPVFEAKSAIDMLMKHASETPPAPSRYSEYDVSVEVDELVLACLEKEKSSRLASVDALDARLAALQPALMWTPEQARQWWDMHRPEQPAEPPPDSERTTIDGLTITKFG